jgi:DNA repair protein RadA/Sms
MNEIIERDKQEFNAARERVARYLKENLHYDLPAFDSSFKDKILGNDLVAFGEVGLGGEVRPVAQTERRLKECEHLGLKRVLLAAHKESAKNSRLQCVPISSLTEIIKHT